MADQNGPSPSIEERRKDAAFMARIKHRVTEDATLLDRLRDGECNQPLVLVRIERGGAGFIYECPVCLARVYRTAKADKAVREREQAEADALPPTADRAGEQS